MAAGGAWGSAPSWATGLPGRLHDFVKTVLLHQLVSPHTTVCDLLCGRGADTSKWAAAGIGSYIGLDLSASALEDAEEEWRTIGKPYAASFCQLDPLLGELESKLQDKGIPYDTVCCLGHLQDSFSSEDKVKQLLQNVVSLLKPGGFFFGITADASTLWSKYQKAVESALKSGALRYGTYPRVKSELYTISFEDDRFNIFNTRYQLRFVDDGLAPQSQILVHFPSLIRLAKEAGLEYIEIQNLDEFFEDYRSHFPDAFTSNCSSFLDPKGKLMPQIRDVLSLYTTFIFRKADVYSPGRAPMHVDYDVVPLTASVPIPVDAGRSSEQKTELRSFSRRSHKRPPEADSKKKPLFRKESEAETQVVETSETNICEQSQQPTESRDAPELRSYQQVDIKDNRCMQTDATIINRDLQRVESRVQERVQHSAQNRESESSHNVTETREVRQTERDGSRHYVAETKDLQSYERRHHVSETKELRTYERSHRQTESGTRERESKELRSNERSESKELRTYERGHRDSRKHAREDGVQKPNRERHGSSQEEELTSTAGTVCRDVETAPRASSNEVNYSSSVGVTSREEDTLPRLSMERSNVYSGTKEETAVADVCSSVSVCKDDENVPGSERIEGCKVEAMSVDMDGLSPAEPPSAERTETGAYEMERSTSQTPAHEYKRRSHSNRWNKPCYPPPPPLPQHHQHFPSPEEIRAEMEAVQKRLNVPSILGPGPAPLMLHAYRRDPNRNMNKDRNYHR